jgi:predicted enzyme related to lactoylglutathione lyase
MQEEELTLITLQLVAADVASLFTAYHTQLGWAVAQGDSSGGTLFADADQTAVAECLADFKQFYSRYIEL